MEEANINEVSSDEEPSAISFASGKKQRQEEFQKESSAKHDQKQKLKNKRHEKHDRLKEQKETKKQRLEIEQLPEEFLQSLPIKPVELHSDELTTETSSSELISTAKNSIKSKELSKEKQTKPIETEDFIPIDGCNTKFNVRILEEEDKLSRKIANQSLEFLNRRLHGKYIKRESSKNFRNKMEKQFIGRHRQRKQ